MAKIRLAKIPCPRFGGNVAMVICVKCGQCDYESKFNKAEEERQEKLTKKRKGKEKGGKV